MNNLPAFEHAIQQRNLDWKMKNILKAERDREEAKLAEQRRIQKAVEDVEIRAELARKASDGDGYMGESLQKKKLAQIIIKVKCQ